MHTLDVGRSMHKTILRPTPADVAGARPRGVRSVLGLAALSALGASALAVHACMPLKPSGDRPCAHRQPPPPPNVTNRGGTHDFVLAVFSVETGWNSKDDAGIPRYRSIGFDLDDTCTDEGQGPSCVEPSWAIAPHTDGEGGIDNALGQLEWWPADLDPGEAAVQSSPPGTRMLVRVQEYSGELDDDQVTVSLYYAYWPSPRMDGKTGLLWDGLDRWAIASDVLVAPADGAAPSVDQPLYVDKHAYVSAGVLVARFDEAVVRSATLAPTLLLPVRRMVLEGTLRQVASGLWELDDGVVGARMSTKDALRQAAYASTALGISELTCKNPDAKRNTITETCELADIAYDSDSPQAPCDALSLGFRFQAKEASLGDIASPKMLPTCDSSWDPDNQSCEPLESH